MNLSDIITKCYILALIIRDDGERLLLGDGIFEFKNSLQHFAPNIYQNDIVELQGTDGQLLAGQVRRSATQAFDGYIADGTIGKTDTEQSRRRFLGFFRKKHHYKVVYIMPDGTAVQRDRGYIVDAPAVQELYQRFPEYHIGLNFEDPNYYEYSENDEGEEIYTHIQAIALFRELEAGLVWDAFGAVSDDIAWTEYMTKNSTDGYILIGNGLPVEAPLSLTHLYGNATQKTLSGKNLLGLPDGTYSNNGITATVANGTITLTGTASGTSFININIPDIVLNSAWSISLNNTVYGDSDSQMRLYNSDGTTYMGVGSNTANAKSENRTNYGTYNRFQIRTSSGVVAGGATAKPQVELGSVATQWQEYVGGIPSPNPDYPQDVETVSGAQTVKITGKNLCYSANRVSNTTLEFFCECATIKSPNVALSFITDFTTPGNASVYSFIDGVDLHTTVGLIATTAGQRSATTLDLTAIMSQIKDGTTLRLMVYRGGSTFTSVSDAQIELGSATAYEPYQGQSYAISFGNTYLAKIGDYADEPVKVDGTWYIRRAIGKVVLDGTEAGWGIFSNNNAFYSRAYDAQIPSPMTTVGAIMANYYTADSESNIYNARVDYGIGISSQNRFLIRNKDITTVANLKTWLGTHNTTVYYALATPIDTEITDSELIAQLNHIYELYQGTNNLWLIPSAGAQGEMTVRFGVAYDDDGSGYHWSEELGSPDNIISNDGIDSVRPIWTINGPATNPSLTNITTAQTITWNGTVPADSTLTIDMERQTATLNGANVYAQIEGDWLELAVGPNKLQYTASGGATADSTLEWNGVAG